MYSLIRRQRRCVGTITPIIPCTVVLLMVGCGESSQRQNGTGLGLLITKTHHSPRAWLSNDGKSFHECNTWERQGQRHKALRFLAHIAKGTEAEKNSLVPPLLESFQQTSLFIWKCSFIAWDFNFFIFLLSSRIKRPALFRCLQSAESGNLRWRRRHVLPQRTFGNCVIRVLNFLIGVIVAGPVWSGLFFQLLLFPPLLLTQQLLSFKHDPGVEAMASHVAVPWSLITGISWVVFCALKTFTRRIVLLPRILRHRACIFAALPEKGKEKGCM